MVTEHIMEHINLLKTTDPGILQIFQEMSLNTPVNNNPNTPPQPQAAQPGALQQNAGAQAATVQQQPTNLPQPAQPAEAPSGAPVTAAEGFNNQVIGR